MKKTLTLVCSALFAVFGCSVEKSNKTNAENAARWHLAFWANLNANLENCLCGEPPLGGLDRIAYAVDSLRGIYPDVVAIDGGDAFTPYSFPEYNKLVVESYYIVNPDIWLAGEQERRDEGVYGENLKRKTGAVQAFKKDSLLVLTWVEPSLMAVEPNRLHEEFKNKFNSIKAGYRVLLFHGGYEGLEMFIKKYPPFDLVLLAHAQSTDVELQRKPPLVGGFADGEVLVHIKIDKKEPHKIEVEKLEMGLKRGTHPRFLEIIEKTKRLTSKQEEIP